MLCGIKRQIGHYIMEIPLEYFADHLTCRDDSTLWKTILVVLAEEFLRRYRNYGDKKESWYLRIGACSHWVRPHQMRWTAAGGFAWPVGYKGASGWSDGLPEFDWSGILVFDGQAWNRVNRFRGKRQIVLRVAVPTRTKRHKQAAIHAMWSTSHRVTFYGFRNIGGGNWVCVAASDEAQNGRIAIGRTLFDSSVVGAFHGMEVSKH
jgi:hypothetical protein